MLTNNKKNFVRSIAMLLAMLMVMAVCLTGCGNKTADEALTKAEEAKTVADEVKAALADYLKNADAEAKVSALVDAALADGYASAEELDALAKKLEQYVTTDKVAELIKNEVAAAAIEGAMTKDEIMKILENYYTKDEVDKKLNNYFGEFSAEAVQKMLKDVDKAMNEEEWDKASDVVIATIDDMQGLMDALGNCNYTQANMAAVNKALEPLNIVAFEKNADGKLEKLSSYTGNFAKMLEYSILRVASLDAMNALKDAVSDALAVPTYQSEYVAMANQLYALGELVPMAANENAPYDANGAFVAAKWAADGSYHGVNYKKDAQKLTQVVTLNDKDAFYAWLKAADALFVTYAKDDLAVLDTGTVYSVFSKTTTTTAAGVTTTTVDIRTQLQTVGGSDTMTGYTKVGETVWDDATYVNRVYGTTLKDNEVMEVPNITITSGDLNGTATDYKTIGYGDSTINNFIWTDALASSVPTTVISDTFTAFNAASGQIESAIKSVYQQLVECQTIVNAANEIFGSEEIVDNFLYGTVFSNSALASGVFEDVTDAKLLDALTAAMCEAGAVTYQKYLTDVTALMERSLQINGKSSVGIKKYDLYLQMISKSYDLLWVKYQNEAYSWLNDILADYVSVVDYANTTNDHSSWPTASTVTSSSEFVKAFVAGTAFTSGKYQSLKVDFSNNNLQMYYENNGKAATFGGVGGTSVTRDPFNADPVATIKNNAEDINLRLTGSVLDFNVKIASANKDEMKASGVAVQQAFYSILKEAIANLDEVYDRFLLDDYKKMTYNDTQVLADAVIEFYYDTASGANASSASASYDGVTKAMVKSEVEKYLFAIDAAGKFGGTTEKNSGTTTIKSLTPGENDLGKKFGVKLNNNQLVTNISSISVNKYSTDATTKVAADAMAKIDAYADQAIAKIENLVIKANFEDYLNEARINSVAVRSNYLTQMMTRNGVAETYGLFMDAMLNLQLVSSETDDSISIVSYNAKRGESGIALDDFKATYIEVLTLIADTTNPHIALLKGESISKTIANKAAYMTSVSEAKMKEVKSSAVPQVDGATTAWVDVVTSGAKARFTPFDTVFGSAVVALDKVANAHAVYTVTKGGITTESKLY